MANVKGTPTSGDTGGTAGKSMTVTLPSGAGAPVAGDYIVIGSAISANEDASVSGYTRVWDSASSVSGCSIFYKQAGASESNPTIDWSAGSNRKGAWICKVVENVSGVSDSSVVQDNTNGSTVDSPAVTADGAGSLLLCFVALLGDVTVTVPSGMSNQVTESETSPQNVTVSGARQTVGDGSTGAKSWTPDSSNRGGGGSIVFADDAEAQLTAEGLQHGSTTAEPGAPKVTAAGAEGLQHGSMIEEAPATIEAPASAEGLQHGSTIEEAPADLARTASGEGIQHAQTIEAPGAPKEAPASPAGLQHGHTIDEAGVLLEAAISVTPEGLQHGHTIDAPAGLRLVGLSAGELQHAHTIDEASILKAVQASAGGLQHGHTIDEAGVLLEAAISVTPEGLQHGHTIEAPAGLRLVDLSAGSLQHASTIGEVLLARALQLAGEEMQHGHTIDAFSLGITAIIEIDPESLQHASTIGEAGALRLVDPTGAGLQHGSTIAGAILSRLVAFDPEEINHLSLIDPESLSRILGVAPEEIQHIHTIEAGTVVLGVEVIAENPFHAVQTRYFVVRKEARFFRVYETRYFQA